jgi:alkylation response protein AidB-like acyl-CoA dehydrogenase
VLLEVNADQRFFVETTAKFLEERAPAAELRRLRDDPVGFDPAYWRDGAHLGWTSLLVDEALGGGRLSDHGLSDLALLATEFGRRAAPGPLLSVNVVAAALNASPGGESSAALAQLLSGQALMSWCPDQQADGRQGLLPSLWVESLGDTVVVRGSARPVESAGSCSRLLVTGHTGDDWTQVLVPVGAPGVVVTPLTSVDLTRRFSAVRFDDVTLGAEAVVGEVGSAGPQVAAQRRIALLLAAAESVGAMQAGFDMTVEWAFDRFSFGRPLASYQELKHRFADMKTWLEAAHAASNAATQATATEMRDAEELLSASKAFIGTYGSELLQDCVQMHGGIGVTFDHDLHLLLRRHTLDRVLYGTPADHHQRLADLVDQEEES